MWHLQNRRWSLTSTIKNKNGKCQLFKIKPITYMWITWLYSNQCSKARQNTRNHPTNTEVEHHFPNPHKHKAIDSQQSIIISCCCCKTNQNIVTNWKIYFWVSHGIQGAYEWIHVHGNPWCVCACMSTCNIHAPLFGAALRNLGPSFEWKNLC